MAKHIVSRAEDPQLREDAHCVLETIREKIRFQAGSENDRVCLQCGYDLRGQTDLRCPECGEPFDETLLDFGDSVPS